MKTIALTQGKECIVDDEDYDRLNAYKWYTLKIRQRFTALRRGRMINGKQGRTIYMHREIMLAPPNLEVDHINGDALDNRKCNLRLVTDQQQSMSFRRKAKGKSSRFRGVHWHKLRKKWTAQIHSRDRFRHLGLFHDERDAACAYNIAALEWFGDFAQINDTDS